MSLLSAFNNARSSLAVTSQQSAVVSRNMANASDPTATRKFANQVYDRNGAVDILSVSQSSDPALYRSMINGQAAVGTNETVATALDRVRQIIGDVDAQTSPSASIAAMKNALTDLAASPENAHYQRAAVDAARDLALNLNNATDAIQTMRKDADTELANGAKRLNQLLGDLETLNAKVVSGTVGGKDVTDEMDQRDRIVAEISGYVGVNVRVRANNDLVLSTDSGIVMFENRARSVEFTPTQAFDPEKRAGGAKGAPGEFKIDGISIGGSSSMAVREGSLVAALKLRDDIGNEFQDRIDQIGTTLVEHTFAEQKTAADGTVTTVPGLFERTGPGTISISQRVDYRLPGGDAARIRDGGIADATYTYNTDGESGFSGRINELVARFDDNLTFANGEVGRLSDFSSGSMAWFEGVRGTARENASYQTTMVARAREVLSSTTGINIEEEMTHLLDLERSYQASSKLIQTVNSMFDSLLAIR
ncbi:flagellar hook-associated protein FlgK [Fulvimarina endophytica]|uniref:Flagellar hook-associated protein 1 n=1 Tax=Fulvimarina endophytica TaxID=2293836 RepID=A0A371X1E0_9HYPH|nr:flagellar hook-associated protein FlgK [Fulvimarina endophytica]RFC63007.1 flagellar hook-associated protein FlgK [Fulvimarina endophytica]